jgi:hypothetical protein
MRWVGMRGVGSAVAVAAVLTVAPNPVSAAPGPVAAARAATPQRVCTLGDDRLDEISGLAATGAGYVLMNDGTDLASHRKIFFLDGRCRVTRAVSYPSRPRDPEDLAITPDGTVWVADIGDNDRSRSSVALWRLPRGARTPTLYRLAYPDGAHDAEAVVVTPAGRPVIVTKDPLNSGIYAPTGALKAGRTVPMERVGVCRLSGTGTRNPFGFAGRAVVTGAALSPAGDRVVVRTYADAFEYDVSGGDVVAALTRGRPKTTALPDEPQGESIAYSRDGRSLLTVSETVRQPAGTRAAILRYPAADRPEPVPTAAASLEGAGGSAAKSVPAAARTDRSPPTGLAILVAAAALLLAAAVIRAARRRRR